MALVGQWRYSWFCVFLLVFLELDVGLTHQDGYYSYSDHSIQRRSTSNNIQLKLAPPSQSAEVHTNETVSTSTTPPTPSATVNSAPAGAGVNYNVTNNSSGANPDDANRTSQLVNSTINITSTAIPNGSPLIHQENNRTVSNNSSEAVSNITAGVNSTVVVPEGIPAGADNDSTPIDDINDFTLNEFGTIRNETLREHNVMRYQTDHHMYYNSVFITDNETAGHHYWVDMNRSDVVTNDMLSQSHRRAVTVKLSFHFPFYGHVVRNVTVATGGFLYTGEYVHSWLAATQYIAPLMANFDTSISKDSYVKYIDNGTAFTVQWEKVVLQDKPTSGDFTFQATLHQNGDIVFVYQNVPVVIRSIQDDQHPVKVGLSDAYIIDRTIFFVRRKTIYEYHRVNFDRQEIKNWTVIVLKALPTCVDHKDCESCLAMNTTFQCLWCPLANRCSTGTDRNRQDWLNRGCDKSSLDRQDKCPAVPTNVSHDTLSPTSGISNHIGEGETNSAAQTDHSGENTGEHSIAHGDNNVTVGISGIIGILFMVVLVASLGIWALYAYRNPHTASGQFLIRYRPSQWSWKRGEARYTAATIHM